MFKKLRPLGNRVLVERREHEEKTAGGIIIPDAAKEKAQLGLVLAVGSGTVHQDGRITPMQVKVGDTIFFGKYAGVEAGRDQLILREDEILGVVEE
jgi:chaperonin GroES